MDSLLFLPVVFISDLLLGDPGVLPHPVVWMGRLVEKTEGLCRKIFPDTPSGLRTAGVVLVATVLTVTAGISMSALWLAGLVHPAVSDALAAFWGFQVLATKTLHRESHKVWQALKDNNLPAARKAVSNLVGRDTQNMTQEEVIKATVETVAENTCDAIAAPIFFMAAGGVVFGLIYKAVNTMDSMVGYRNDRYRHFGTAAAKLDDIANYLPARVAALLMIAAARLSGQNAQNAYRVWKKDRRSHKSPNSAQTESVSAGALGVMLGGDAYYFGKLVAKPTIGQNLHPIQSDDILRANRLSLFTAVLCLFAGVMLQSAMMMFFKGGV